MTFMKKITKSQVEEVLCSTGLVPVFYNQDAETGKRVMQACYEGGVRAFEFTNRGDKAEEVFGDLADFASELPGMVLGAGSISFAKDARKFISLGASFIVGPQYVPGVLRVCRWHNVEYIPGCGTVSEVGRAQRAGCGICKLFPGDVLGPRFVKGLLAPMPWSRLIVTGGVKPEKENLETWFKAGASCVGIGSNLFPKEVISSGQWERISELCRETLETISLYHESNR